MVERLQGGLDVLRTHLETMTAAQLAVGLNNDEVSEVILNLETVNRDMEFAVAEKANNEREVRTVQP